MTNWVRPAEYVEELPSRPTAIHGADPAWQLVPARRLPAYVESSIVHGLQWVVFEPNGQALWTRVCNQVNDFMDTVWRGGNLPGTRPREAYFVRCDRSTMTQEDIDNGRLVVLVGVATVRPAEFVIFRIGMWTSDSKNDPDPDQPDE